MQCYLCHSNNFSERKGEVRDASSMKILGCNECGLVSLDSNSHIQSGFYENSGMHGNVLRPIEEWLKETYWDDERRFEQLKSFLPNKGVLDFGCGAGGFLAKAKDLDSNAVGVELERRVQEHWKDSEITILPSIDEAKDASRGGVRFDHGLPRGGAFARSSGDFEGIRCITNTGRKNGDRGTER